MKISMVTRLNEALKWGGDLQAIYTLSEGMRLLGHEVEIVTDLSNVGPSDYLFICNTCIDLRPSYNLLKLQNRSYGLIGFHEDAIQHFGPSYGFYDYVNRTLKELEDEGVRFSLESLFENPEIIHYYSVPPRRSSLINYPVMRDAAICVVSSETEAKTLKRDCPSAHVKVVYWASEMVQEEPNNGFLHWVNLQKGEYILQVGRMELRKNQLASILATKDLDIPLVFIATHTTQEFYEKACIEAILKWRKAPTYIISQSLTPFESGYLRIISMPNQQKLSSSLLQSAYAHAGLHLHPTFYELPGYTYLEAAKQGIPTVASSWGSIRDYFTDWKTGTYCLDDRLEYCLPYDLPSITTCVIKKFGQKFASNPDLPIFRRTKMDVASELLSLIQKNGC